MELQLVVVAKAVHGDRRVLLALLGVVGHHVDSTVVLHLLKPLRIGPIHPGVHGIDLGVASRIHARVVANVVNKIGRTAAYARSLETQGLKNLNGAENDTKHGNANYSTTRSIIQAEQRVHDANPSFSRH